MRSGLFDFSWHNAWSGWRRRWAARSRAWKGTWTGRKLHWLRPPAMWKSALWAAFAGIWARAAGIRRPSPWTIHEPSQHGSFSISFPISWDVRAGGRPTGRWARL